MRVAIADIEELEIKDSEGARTGTKDLKPDNVEFSKRLTLAADRSDGVPRINGGRFSHIMRQMKIQGHPVSRETIRKWFSGEARPRADKMPALATVLKVDEAWLAVGKSPSSLPAVSKALEVHNEAGVNLVMGIMGLAGATCALPDSNDPLSDSVHFYAILNGRQKRVFVTVGQRTKDNVRFHGPGNFDGICTIAVVQTDFSRFSLFEITPKEISKNARSRGGYVEFSGTLTVSGIQLGTVELKELIDFRNLGG
jgi:transcriptional regulator with XRE-family HTH domain